MPGLSSLQLNIVSCCSTFTQFPSSWRWFTALDSIRSEISIRSLSLSHSFLNRYFSHANFPASLPGRGFSLPKISSELCFSIIYLVLRMNGLEPPPASRIRFLYLLVWGLMAHCQGSGVLTGHRKYGVTRHPMAFIIGGEREGMNEPGGRR